MQGTPIVVSCSLRCTFAPTARPRDGEIFTCNNGKKEIQCEAKTSCATIVVTGRDNDDGMISNEFARCESGRLRQKEGDGEENPRGWQRGVRMVVTVRGPLHNIYRLCKLCQRQLEDDGDTISVQGWG